MSFLIRAKIFSITFFLFAQGVFAQLHKTAPPEVMVCKYAWTYYFDVAKNYNSVCCVTDGFTANSCSLYICPGETFYLAGQVITPVGFNSPYNTTYTATWDFGGLAISVTDSANSFCNSITQYDSMTPLHPVTIPANASPGTSYSIFYSYSYLYPSWPLVTDTPSIVNVIVVPDSIFNFTLTPDSQFVNGTVNVSYSSNIPLISNQPGVLYNFGDGTGSVATQSYSYSDTGTFIICAEQIGTFCFHKQSDTVHILDYVGIRENNFGLNFSVFPNPFSSDIIFSSETFGNYTLKIIDISGKLIAMKNFTGEKLIYQNLELQPGIYFYEINNNIGNSTRGKIFKNQ